MWENFIGKKSVPVKNDVEKGAVRKFVEAIGDINPIYVSEEEATNSPHGQLIAPPTFPRTFDYGKIPGLEFPKAGMIHGEQYYHYYRPIYVGEVLYCHEELVDVQEKEGKSGKMTIVKLRQFGESVDGERVFLSERTSIVTPKVKEMFLNEA